MSIVTKESNQELYEALFDGMPPFIKQDCEGCYEYRKLQQEIKDLMSENEIIRKRLSHLLESDTIKGYDEVDINTKEYKKNIKDLDEIIKLKKQEKDDKMYQLSYELATKGIDIEEFTKKIISMMDTEPLKTLFDLTVKNYKYLKRGEE